MSIFKDSSLEAAFLRDGFVLLDILGGPEVARLAEVHRRTPPPGQSTGFIAGTLLDDRPYRRAIDAEVRSVLGGPLLSALDGYRLVNGTFAIKMPAVPGDDGAVGFHQDPTFVNERRYSSLTVWCPLIDVSPENGCLYLVPGSHRYNHRLRANGPFPYRDLEGHLRARRSIYLSMKAGQALLMHPATFHGSPPNLTDRTRVVAAGIAVPEDAPLIFCYRRPGRSGREMLEIYEVDDTFYIDHVVIRRPTSARLVGMTPYRFDPLDAEQLATRPDGGPA